MPRAPGFSALGISGLALVLIAAVALTARQEAPPTVAEFAPQAVEQIKEALPEQADAPGAPTAAGPGPGETSAEPAQDPSQEASVAPSVASSEPEVIAARVRACFNDGGAPRQTEDPQSPPCVNYFDGDDNGGATSKGVTADEIVVALPAAGFGDDEVNIQAFVDHFNNRYEFYGRKITLKAYNPTGGSFGTPNPADMLADAVKVDQELGAFASLGYVDRQGAEHPYYDELSRRGVLSVYARLLNNGTEERLRQFAPHQWNVYPSIETAMGLIGSAICQTLAGKPTDGGGTGTAGAPERIFGLITNRGTDGSLPPVEVLTGMLASCNVTLAATHEDAADTTDYVTAILKMRDGGVTSVICLCIVNTAREGYLNSATQQLYFPEWVMGSYLNMDLDNSYHGTNPDQQENVLGVGMWNARLPRQQMPWWRAYKEVRPSEDPAGGNYYTLSSRYSQLLLLASGIQLAGPDLTPESFEAGLHAASFPNPNAGQAPQFQARVGFEGGRHSMMDSAHLFWYSASDGGTVDPAYPGAICLVNGGTRSRIGSFPTEPQPFFQGPCK